MNIRKCISIYISNSIPIILSSFTGPLIIYMINNLIFLYTSVPWLGFLNVTYKIKFW